MGRSEIISKTGKVSSSYSCGVCCPNGFGTGGITPYTVFTEIGGFEEFTANQQDQDCYGNYYSWYPVTANWRTDDSSIASMDANIKGRANAIDVGETFVRATWDAEYFADRGSGACDALIIAAAVAANMSVRPKVTNVTATGATKISQVQGDQTIIHFVTPKGAANTQVTLTATLDNNTQAVLSEIQWEGATESATNPLQATISKSSAAKNTIKIKYRGQILKNVIVWVVWATTTSEAIDATFVQPITVLSGVIGAQCTGGYKFTHTIQPTTITTEFDVPDFDLPNQTAPPGGNHPVFGSPLSGGADKRWDNSRQIRIKIVNPFNIPSSETIQPPLVNVPNYPANEVEGNDDRSQVDEINTPYEDEGKLFGEDQPEDRITNRAGNENQTYESRLHFREFVRLEIEGTWYKVSDYYPWKLHAKFKKIGGVWTDNGCQIALDNSGF